MKIKANSSNISIMQPNSYVPQPPQVPAQYQNQMLPPPKNKRHYGALITIVLLVLLSLGLAGFGAWAFKSLQDLKGPIDKKIADAVVIAKQQESTVKDKEFVEKEKKPFKEYRGPATYGSLVIQYPKTWSGFVTEGQNGNAPVDGYFHPNVVPGLLSGTAFAMRVKILNQSYVEALKSFSEKERSGKVAVSAYRAPNVQSVLGSRVDGEINPGQKDSMVIFPIRDKTLQISTESDDFLGDFDTNILPNITFAP